MQCCSLEGKGAARMSMQHPMSASSGAAVLCAGTASDQGKRVHFGEAEEDYSTGGRWWQQLGGVAGN